MARDRLELDTWGESGPEKCRLCPKYVEEKTRAPHGKSVPRVCARVAKVKGHARKRREVCLQGAAALWWRAAELHPVQVFPMVRFQTKINNKYKICFNIEQN